MTLAVRLAVICAVLVVGCEPEPRGLMVQRVHCFYTWDPCPSAVLSCAKGVLRYEMGAHSAKIWCEPADGGAR